MRGRGTVIGTDAWLDRMRWIDVIRLITRRFDGMIWDGRAGDGEGLTGNRYSLYQK